MRFLSVLTLALVTASLVYSQSFTYQGFLREGGAPANGTYQMIFRLYQLETGGSPLVSLAPAPVSVVNGLFTRELNFGPVWIGNSYWMEIQVGSNTLAPRVKINPTPYAHTAMNALALQGRQVSSAPPSFGQLLKWNNNTWAPADDLRDEFWQADGNNIHYTGGNVGIGIASPASKLHVQGALRVEGNIRVADGSSIFGLSRLVGASDLRLAGGNISGWHLALSADGRVGHRYSYSNVNFNVQNSGFFFAFNVERTSGVSLLSVLDEGIVRAPGLRNIGDRRNMQFNDSSGEIGWDSSSRRYKENITLLDDDYFKVLLLEPKTYTRIGEDPHRWEIGYIAEELHDIGLSRLVEYNSEGLPDGVNYEKMVLYLNEIIKRQQIEINELKKGAERTSEVERRLKKLENLIENR